MNPSINDRLEALASLLGELESELRSLGEWSDTPPSDDAFMSQQPFCYDTMTLPQWLQFIFLPKMRLLMAQCLPLPARCGITPMAEEFFKLRLKEAKPLFTVLESIDRLLGGLPQH